MPGEMPELDKCPGRGPPVRPRLWLACGLMIGLAGQAEAPLADAGTRSAVDRLVDDAADGQLDQFSLIEGALIAGGVHDPQHLQACLDLFRRRASRLNQLDRPHAPPRQRAVMVLRFLHRELLTGDYDPDATQLAGMFQTGQFNCVSSAVLFQALCQQIGLTAWPVLGEGHVSCVVPSDGRHWLVECSSADWPDLLAAGDRRTDFVLGATGSTGRAPRSIRPAQLLAVIYYNRAIGLLEAGCYRDSIAANLAAWRVDPDNGDVRQNLLAAINNWAVSLIAAGRYVDAARVLATGRKIAPGYEKFLHNEMFLYQRWARQPRADRHS